MKKKRRILVIGRGGREHALCWRLSRSESVAEVYCAPGNAGTRHCAKNIAIDEMAFDQIIEFIMDNAVDLVVVGPEAPLCGGIVDRLTAAGIAAFGPTAAAARIEGSKAFAKSILQSCGIATAASALFSEASAAIGYVCDHPLARVIKADGLAAGKGVVVAETEQQAVGAINAHFDREISGRRSAGGEHLPIPLLIEEKLIGSEVSVFALVDGTRSLVFDAARDYKRIYDGDRGPNTGGMGAISPVPGLTAGFEHQIKDIVIDPVVTELARQGCPFRGLLYAGIMLTENGPYVLEFNCRFGDPETQGLLMRLQGDFGQILWECATGQLSSARSALNFDSRSAVTVVAASAGYPGVYDKNVPISGLSTPEQSNDLSFSTVFHAGTRYLADTAGGGNCEDAVDSTVLTDGGRVLSVSALADTVSNARSLCYSRFESGDSNTENIDSSKIFWHGMQFRSDIGL